MLSSAGVLRVRHLVVVLQVVGHQLRHRLERLERHVAAQHAVQQLADRRRLHGAVVHCKARALPMLDDGQAAGRGGGVQPKAGGKLGLLAHIHPGEGEGVVAVLAAQRHQVLLPRKLLPVGKREHADGLRAAEAVRVCVLRVQAVEAGGRQLLGRLGRREGGQLRHALLALFAQREGVHRRLGRLERRRVLAVQARADNGKRARALLVGAADARHHERGEGLHAQALGNLRVRRRVRVAELDGLGPAVLVLGGEGGEPGGRAALVRPRRQQQHLGGAVLMQEPVGVQVRERRHQLAGRRARPGALLGKGHDRSRLARRLVVRRLGLVLAKGLDGGEALHVVLGAQRLVAVLVAVDGAQARGALQLLGRLLPLRRQLLAVPAPGRVELHHGHRVGSHHRLLKVVAGQREHIAALVVKRGRELQRAR
mmetsp:Transcript_42128/g.109228  ORF Transcript_42128/g.109228 Transcript_42128/m.109228 type:complete len:425 (+) Transcript_42128:247-1521(+)